MDLREGTLLLLRRTKMLTSSAGLDQVTPRERTEAETIVKALDGLPLALDQAGAYIDETQCGLSGYLDLYHARHQDLLQWQSPLASYPETVATTWSLSFQKIEQANPAAADLLRLCAFLNADAIPEEIFTKGAADLGPILKPVAADLFKLNEAIRELRKFSLIRRDPDTKTLTVHRLVQLVLIDKMKKRTRQQWIERAVRAVYRAFPNVESAAWQDCQRYIPHIQACMTHIEQWNIKCIEASKLFDRAGFYLWKCGQYAQAETFCGLALAIGEETLGKEHPDVALYLNNLALIYQTQSKYTQALSLYEQALAIREKALGPTHLDVAVTLNNLALIYRAQGKYMLAEQLFLRSLSIRRQTLGEEHRDVALCLHNLAGLYQKQGKSELAEPLFIQALAIYEHAHGEDHLAAAPVLDSLAGLYVKQGKYTQAEPLCRRALTIREKNLGEEHPYVAFSLTTLGKVYEAQGLYEQAESLSKRALDLREKTLGPMHSRVAESLKRLADLYSKQSKYPQAEPLYKRGIAIFEQTFGQEHPHVAGCLNGLARLYDAQGEYTQAEYFYKQVLALYERTLGPDHLRVSTCLEHYAALLRKMQREIEAVELEVRAKEIQVAHKQ
jgi:tetratricopeptide (TPR) repeat protein